MAKTTAKKETKSKAPKAEKPKKTAQVEGGANVGPVAGTLEVQPDAVKAPEAAPKVGTAKAKTKDLLGRQLEEQFAAIQKTLTESCKEKKQPRQLRWALRSLDDAKDLAVRYVKTAV